MMLTKIYRRYVPASIRMTVYRWFLGSLMSTIRLRRKHKTARKIPPFYEREENRSVYPEEYYAAARRIKERGYMFIPYDFVAEYDRLPVEVLKCEETGMKYVLHNGRRVYFPDSFSAAACKKLFRGLLAEQDIRSPHRYDYSCFDGDTNWTVFDIGAAEGIFTLNVIDKISKAYLFECDKQWQKALNATFKPYGDKVEIIGKYVSDKDADTDVRLDTFVKDMTMSNGYIKMDIEGAEPRALKGAESLLEHSQIRFMSVCTYHSARDAEEICDYLKSRRYACSFSPGIIAYGEDPPYFRKGVLYARK